MSKDPRPKDFKTWITPYILVNDVMKSIEFYRNAFGFEVKGEPISGPDGIAAHAELRYQDAFVMIGRQGSYESTTQTPKGSNLDSPISLYVYVDDVDKFTARAKEVGAEVIKEPEDAFWGDRMSSIKDIDGYQWTFATNFGECDLSKMKG